MVWEILSGVIHSTCLLRHDRKMVPSMTPWGMLQHLEVPVMKIMNERMDYLFRKFPNSIILLRKIRFPNRSVTLGSTRRWLIWHQGRNSSDIYQKSNDTSWSSQACSKGGEVAIMMIPQETSIVKLEKKIEHSIKLSGVLETSSYGNFFYDSVGSLERKVVLISEIVNFDD